MVANPPVRMACSSDIVMLARNGLTIKAASLCHDKKYVSTERICVCGWRSKHVSSIHVWFVSAVFLPPFAKKERRETYETMHL